MTLDLSDLLDPKAQPKPVRKSAPAAASPAARKRSTAKHGEHAEEICVMFTEWHCSACGAEFETPTYGDIMTRFAFYQRGRKTHDIYRPYCKEVHVNLPVREELLVKSIPTCRHCAGEQS